VLLRNRASSLMSRYDRAAAYIKLALPCPKLPCYKMVAAAAPPDHSRRSSARLDSDAVDGPSATSSTGVDRTHPGAGGHRPEFNLFSRTASAALFASLALCLVLFCAYTYVARRRAISGMRRRFFRRVLEDLELVPDRPPGRADESPLPRVPTTTLPAPAVPETPPSPAVRGDDSGPAGDCPVCLEPLRVGGDVTAAHACGHVFHAPCIEPWLHQHDSCPVCRCTVKLQA
jgi:hypothetical protein